jgi:glycopeptide antibiotics resistance protein
VLHRHPFLSLVTLGYLGFVAWLTLTPGSIAPTSSGLAQRVLARLQRSSELSWLTDARAEYLANIALFVPAGLFLLLLVGTRFWWTALMAAIVMTSVIEAAQRSIPGRVPDERDIVANSIGAVIGVAVGVVLTLPATVRRHRGSAARGTAPG